MSVNLIDHQKLCEKAEKLVKNVLAQNTKMLFERDYNGLDKDHFNYPINLVKHDLKDYELVTFFQYMALMLHGQKFNTQVGRNKKKPNVIFLCIDLI